MPNAHSEPASSVLSLQQTVERLQARESHLLNLLSLARDAVVAMDTQGMVTDWNPAAEKLLGFSREQAVGAKLSSLIIPEALRGAHEAGLKRFLETRQPTILNQLIEVEAQHRDGGLIAVRTTTNGLASGNHLVEATLHALYELIERDAAAGLLGHARIQIKEKCKVVDLGSIDDADLQHLAHTATQSGSKLVLLRVESAISVYTFWAILMNEQSWISGSSFNTGWGTHVDPGVAASRAITEAIQSRVTMIHGAREDALIKPVFRKAQDVWGSKAFQYFMNLLPDTPWTVFEPKVPGLEKDLDQTLQLLLDRLVAAGHTEILRCDLTKPDINIPVVRLIAPSLKLRVG